MKNRKPLKIKSLGGLAGELLNAMYNVAEENLLRDPDNAKRICLLKYVIELCIVAVNSFIIPQVPTLLSNMLCSHSSTKYVGLLDLDLTVEDKAYLFEIGERDTIAWIKKHTEIIKQQGTTTRSMKTRSMKT